VQCRGQSSPQCGYGGDARNSTSVKSNTSLGGLETRSGRPGNDAAVTEVCGQRCSGNRWGECGEAIGIFGWERNLGVENRRRHEDLRTVPGRRQVCAAARMVRTEAGTRSVDDLHALPIRDIGHRTSAWKSVGTARCRGAPCASPGYSWETKVALVLAPIGQAVVGSPLWPRLSPNTMCAARCVMPRLR
jgi:hypothetical protein